MSDTPFRSVLHRVLTIGIALVWFINGLFCKLFNLVPRHQAIVGRILGMEHAFVFTKLIGFLEVGMAVWVLVRFRSGLNAIVQVTLVTVMNCIEFFMAPDLLLYGHFNALLALFFNVIILLNQFYLSAEA